MAGEGAYLPFRGLSAWFSCSVEPSTIKLWEQYGGTLAAETEAHYLFSDDSFTRDTTRLYNWQKDIVVIQTSWIKAVVQKKCPARAIALCQHLLTPHFMIGLDLIAREQPTTEEQLTAEEQPVITGQQPVTTKEQLGTPVTKDSPAMKGELTTNVDNSNEITVTGVEKHTTATPSALYSLYNTVWNKLEQDCSDNAPENVTHVKDINRPTTQAPFDFILSEPKFKVYKKN